VAAASGALVALGDAESIPDLIGVIERAGRGGDHVRRALTALTAQDFGASERKWRKWYDAALEVVRSALHGEPERARAAAAALGDLRDVRAIPDLISAADGDHATAEEARRALIQLTKQDFGTKARKWRAWWEKNRDRHRIEWMIDGLVHPDNDVRLSAAEELKRLTGEYFGYHHDLPKRDREEAQKRWYKWWEDAGKRRFMKEGREEHDRPTAMLPIHPPPRRP